MIIQPLEEQQKIVEILSKRDETIKIKKAKRKKLENEEEGYGPTACLKGRSEGS
ncbi:MAG: restriction endonuclease subunit S [Candidatus Freyarchaeota archaeon]